MSGKQVRAQIAYAKEQRAEQQATTGAEIPPSVTKEAAARKTPTLEAELEAEKKKAASAFQTVRHGAAGGNVAAVGAEDKDVGALAAESFISKIRESDVWQSAGNTFGDAAAAKIKATKIELKATLGAITVNLTELGILDQFKATIIDNVKKAVKDQLEAGTNAEGVPPPGDLG